MASRRNTPALITSARVGKSLDARQRTTRYLISMAIRVVCFVSACFAPFPTNLLLFAGAAVIPAFAVVLANAIDHRTPRTTASAEPSDVPALPPGAVIVGQVSEGGPT